jgi:hypothetical protein
VIQNEKRVHARHFDSVLFFAAVFALALVLVGKEAPAATPPQLPSAQDEKPLETAANALEPGVPFLEELSERFGGKEDSGSDAPASAKLTVKEESEESVTKVITSEVSAKGTNGISVLSAKNEKEKSSSDMWFSFEPELKFSGYASAGDIGTGDLVKVTYEDAKDGSSRKLKEVALEKKKPEEARQAEPIEPESEISDEA